MILWRIAAETRNRGAGDLGGGGAAAYPGRWNDAGQPVVYAAPTLAMAVLETAAHVDDAGLPLDRYVVKIEVPSAVWSKREQFDAPDLPAAWDAIPAGAASARAGTAWIRSARSLILLVPSVVVPEEHIALLNPAHRDASKLRVSVLRRFEYNRLFRR